MPRLDEIAEGLSTVLAGSPTPEPLGVDLWGWRRDMELKCPQCGSKDVVKASYAYESGTLSTRSTTVGVAVSADGPIGGIAPTRGQSSSLLAQKAAPPAREHGAGCGAAMIFFLPMVVPFFIFQDASTTLMGYLFLASAVLAIWFYVKHSPEEQNKHHDALREYDRKWICQRCGGIADQSAFAV